MTGYILVAFILLVVSIVLYERKSMRNEIEENNKSTLNHLSKISRMKNMDGDEAYRRFQTINLRCSTTGIVGCLSNKSALKHTEIEKACRLTNKHC